MQSTRKTARKPGLGMLAGLLAGCGMGIAQAAPPPATISFETTGFNHMNTQLIRGSTLHFANPTQSPLPLAIVRWGGPESRVVARFTVPAHGGLVNWKPERDGVYVFYDTQNTRFGGVPIQGEGKERVFQPVAKKPSPYFPAPVYGIVAVTNADGGGIPLSTSYGKLEVPGKSTLRNNLHPFMNDRKDRPWMEVPGGTMTFKPWVVVIRAGQPLHVFDYDAMDHAFFPGDYPVMRVDQGKVGTYHYTFTGFVLQANGGHRVITFRKPGLYHILCVIHSYPWEHTYRSRRFYGGYPYVMDAVVIVEPAAKKAA